MFYSHFYCIAIISPQPRLHQYMCGTPWPSRHCRCCAVTTRVGFALSVLVLQGNSCCLWAWILNTPWPSGSGRKVQMHSNFSSHWCYVGQTNAKYSRLSVRCQSCQSHWSHPEDLCGGVSTRLGHTFCICGHQARAFLDTGRSSFTQQEGCA